MIIDSGLLRTTVDSNKKRQRKLYETMPSQAVISFTIRNDEKKIWYDWWNTNAYDWFEMPFPAFFDPWDSNNCHPYPMRCIADLQVEPAGGDHVRVTTTIEMDLEAAFKIFGRPECYWVVGLGPVDNLRDRVIAGHPQNPSKGVLNPGTPAHPVCPI